MYVDIVRMKYYVPGALEHAVYVQNTGRCLSVHFAGKVENP